jgi:hypothetical protein
MSEIYEDLPGGLAKFTRLSKREYKITHLNTNFNSILGNQLVNNSDNEIFFDNIEPSYKETFISSLESSASNSIPFFYRFEYQADNDASKWLEVRGLPKYNEGHTEWVMTFFDVSKTIKLADENIELTIKLDNEKEKLRAVLESAYESILTLNKDGKIEDCNISTSNLFKYERLELIGKSINKLIDDEYKNTFQNLIKNIFKIETFEFKIPGSMFGKKGNGEKFPIQVSLSTFKFDFKKKITVIIKDISFIFNMNKKIEELNTGLENIVSERTKLMQDALEERNEILQIISHDIRSPLTSIRLEAEMVEKYTQKFDTEKIQKKMKRIIQSTDFANNIFNKLLDSEKESTKNLEKSFSSIEDIVKKAISNNSTKALNKSIIINYQKSGDNNISNHYDVLLSVFDNLISNAVKYSPKNSVVNINLDSSETQTVFKILDNGPGIPANEQKFLFGKFKKLSNKPTDGETSTGLGLYIVKKYVNNLMGNIYLDKNYKEGACFVVELPTKMAV